MIRNAEYTDTPTLVDLGEFMHVESCYGPFEYDKEKVGKLIDSLIYTDSGIALVAENKEGQVVGGMLGDVIEHYFGHEMMAFDYALFIHPDHRGSRDGYVLVKEFTMQAISKGAVHIISGTSTGVLPEVTEKLYKKLGYQDIGKLFTMNVKEFE